MSEQLVHGGTASCVSAGLLSDVDRIGVWTCEPSIVTLVALFPTILCVICFGSGIEPGSAASALIAPLVSGALGGELGHLMKGSNKTSLACRELHGEIDVGCSECHNSSVITGKGLWLYWQVLLLCPDGRRHNWKFGRQP